jgi:hypothetical protein
MNRLSKKRTHQRGYGTGLESIDQIVHQFFPDTIEIETNPSVYANQCLVFELADQQKQVNVGLLTKCEVSGRVSLNQLRDLAVKLHYHRIKLTDASHIEIETSEGNCSFNLALFEILATGQSWYNWQGYFSQSHTIDTAHNQLIRDYPLGLFIAKGREQFPPSVRMQMMSAVELMQGFKQIFVGCDHATIGVIMKCLKQQFFNKSAILNCRDRKVELLNEILLLASKLLHYDPQLELVL